MTYDQINIPLPTPCPHPTSKTRILPWSWGCGIGWLMNASNGWSRSFGRICPR